MGRSLREKRKSHKANHARAASITIEGRVNTNNPNSTWPFDVDQKPLFVVASDENNVDL
jgi:hypothetical protein